MEGKNEFIFCYTKHNPEIMYKRGQSTCGKEFITGVKMRTKTEDKSKILIIYDEAEQQEGIKGPLSTTRQMVKKLGRLDTDELANNLNSFCKQIGEIFDGVTTSVKNYELQSFELTVDVTAKGEIRFVGSVGGELKGGLKLVFIRQKQED